MLILKALNKKIVQNNILKYTINKLEQNLKKCSNICRKFNKDNREMNNT